MKRREFTGLVGAAMTTWRLSARAQQIGRVRRVGVLMAYQENDPGAQFLLAEFTRGLSELGWTVGRNLHIHVRWAPDDVDLMRTYATERGGAG